MTWQASQNLAEDVFSRPLSAWRALPRSTCRAAWKTKSRLLTYADRSAGYNLSLSYISSILAADNAMIPAGTVQNGSGTLSVRTDAQFTSVEDIRSPPLSSPAYGRQRAP